MIDAEFGRYPAAYDKVARTSRTGPAAAGAASAEDRPARVAGPAVILSLSPAAEAALRGKSDAAASAAARSPFDRIEPIAPNATNEFDSAAAETRGGLIAQQMAELLQYDSVLFAKEQLPENEKRYNELINIKPVPAVELKGQEKEFVLELAIHKGLSIGGADTLGFSHEGLIYKIYKDGTVTKNDGNIPTSEKFKQDVLAHFKAQIDLGRTDTTAYEERSLARKKEIAELSAIMETNDPRRS